MLGGTQRLPRIVGIGKAKELIFTAKLCSGLEAQEIGLVEHAVPQNSAGDAAYQKALGIARDIADKVCIFSESCVWGWLKFFCFYVCLNRVL